MKKEEKNSITTNDIEVCAILVQIKGECYQVLSSAANKKLAIDLIGKLDGQLTLSDAMEPVVFVDKK